MSRIGKLPIQVPANVKVAHDPARRTVAFDGPKGKNSFTYRPEVTVQWDESKRALTCTVPESKLEDGRAKAYWGTTRARMQSIVQGVTSGYSRKLEVIGVGWSAKVTPKGLTLAVGYCNPIELPLPPGVTCTVENNVITVSGHDDQAVGQFAAEIRSKRKPEPYNGKGIKYANEVIQRKQGKAFGA